LYSFTGKDYNKGGEDYVKDRKSESGHYVIPTGKVSEDPPPPPSQAEVKRYNLPGFKRNI
jgi:hypothetical protein